MKLDIQKLKDLEDSQALLEKTNAEQQARILELEGQVSRLQDWLARSEEQVNFWEKRDHEHQVMAEGLSTQVAQLEAECNQLAAELFAAIEGNKELNVELAAAIGSYEDEAELARKLIEDNHELGIRWAKLVDRCRELEAENTSLKDKLETQGIRASDERQDLREQLSMVKEQFAREAGLRLLAVCRMKELERENRKLKAVVDAARGIKQREDIGGYGHEGIPELLDALAAMTEGTEGRLDEGDGDEQISDY